MDALQTVVMTLPLVSDSGYGDLTYGIGVMLVASAVAVLAGG